MLLYKIHWLPVVPIEDKVTDNSMYLAVSKHQKYYINLIIKQMHGYKPNLIMNTKLCMLAKVLIYCTSIS